MVEVVWTDDALRMLQEIVAYIANDSPKAAEKVQYKLLAAVDPLGGCPRMGRRVPEFKRDDLRELIVRPYRILYFVTEDACRIVAIYHGKRDVKSAFHPEDFES